MSPTGIVVNPKRSFQGNLMTDSESVYIPPAVQQDIDALIAYQQAVATYNETVDSEADSDAVLDADSDADSEADSETDSDADSDAVSDADSDAVSDTDSDAAASVHEYVPPKHKKKKR